MASACLSLAIAAGFAAPSHGEIRHFSSRLLDAGGNEGIWGLAPGRDGVLFLGFDSTVPLGGVAGHGVAKLDADGTIPWAIALPEGLQSVAFAAMPDGGLALTGGFSSILDFGGGPMVANDYDVFLARFAPTGQLRWQRRYGGNQWQSASAVAIDGAGNIIITGSNALTVDFGGGTIRSNGAEDVFLAKMDPDAGHIWSRGFGYGGPQRGIALDVGAGDRIALAVDFRGVSIDLGDGQIVNRGASDVAAAVFEPGGALVFSRFAGTLFDESVNGIALDAQGNAFLCGLMTFPLDLGGGVLTPVSARTSNGFFASYDAAGAHRWSYLIPDPVRSNALQVRADDLGYCFVLGNNDGNFTFGLHEVTSAASLLLAFGPAGEPIDAMEFSQQGMLLRTSPLRDRMLLGVSTSGKINFGGGTLVSRGTDIALAVMGVRHPPQVSITRIDASSVHDGVEVSWSLAGGEPLGNFWLSRRTDDSPDAGVLHSAIASDGASSFVDRTASPGHIYSYRLTVATALGDEVYSDWVSVDTPAAVNALEQNAPNPFNPLTTFAYSLAAPAQVTIVIYDARGAVIARLEQGEQPAGRHSATWGGHNMHGEFVASGVYFYRLDGVPGVGPRKMLLLK